MRCDVANFLLDTVTDKHGETLRSFLSLLRKRGSLSVASVQHKRRVSYSRMPYRCIIDLAITTVFPMQYVSLVAPFSFFVHDTYVLVFRISWFILRGSVNLEDYVCMWRVWVRRGECIGSWLGNRRERDQWGDLGIDGWILGWISRRWDVGMWTGLDWPKIETGGGRL